MLILVYLLIVSMNLSCITKKNLNQEPVEITQFVSRYVPECKLERYHGKEVSYTLPLHSVPKFQELFRELEISCHAMNVETFGISMTTLEEVFLKLAEVESSESFPQIDLSSFHRKTSDAYKFDSSSAVKSVRTHALRIFIKVFLNFCKYSLRFRKTMPSFQIRV